MQPGVRSLHGLGGGGLDWGGDIRCKSRHAESMPACTVRSKLTLVCCASRT